MTWVSGVVKFGEGIGDSGPLRAAARYKESLGFELAQGSRTAGRPTPA